MIRVDESLRLSTVYKPIKTFDRMFAADAKRKLRFLSSAQFAAVGDVLPFPRAFV